MEEKLARLKEFTAMETELPYPEFDLYYKSVMGALQKDYENMSTEDRIKAKFICDIVGSNAEARAKSDKIHAKQFRKMATKCKFWQEAIEHRLRKDGVTSEEINQDLLAEGEELAPPASLGDELVSPASPVGEGHAPPADL
jgi:hypothetical protein